LFRSPNSQGDYIQEIELGRACSQISEGMSVFKTLKDKPIEKRPQAKPRRTWENQIRIYHKK
jgi:hypothetical protein